MSDELDDEVLEGGEAPEGQDEDDDDEDDPPRVVLGTIGELASWLSPQLARNHRNRPVWFLLQMDEDFVSVLERLPEGPLPPREASSLLEGVRAFASERADGLQEWLGPTDGIVFGYHASATLAQIREAFEADGFLVVGQLREGRVVAEDPSGAHKIDT